MADEYLGYGTQFQLKISSTFTTVAAVRDSNPGDLSVDDVEITSQDSPNGFREYKAGLIDPGEANAELIYDPADPTHLELLAAIKARANREWKIIFPDGTEEPFVGYLKLLGRPTPLESLMTMNVAIKVSGEPG